MESPHNPARVVDMRSDTVTRPTDAMYERMRLAPLGDDGLDGDPTVRELEAVTAGVLGKQAGLFVPSCTMANLLAVLAQVPRQEQVVLESAAHMYTSERGAATFTGAFYLGVSGTSGAMDLGLLEDALQSGGTKLTTALIAIETSHNNAGGAVLPLGHLQAVRALAEARGIPVHLDGARLFNAAVAQAVSPAEIARHADTASVCLSKGLSAPVGAVLVGSRKIIDSARHFRKMLGGTQRQAGLMAAAGLEAVEHMGARLVEDHVRASRFSRALNEIHPKLIASKPQTNIIQVDVSQTARNSGQWVDDVEQVGLRLRPWGKNLLRCVTHRHIDDADIAFAADAFRTVAEKIPG